MDMNFYREWDSRLKGIAHNWSLHCKWLPEDEAYSELILWFAEALHNYSESKGAFGTFFYYYQLKAYKQLKSQWRNKNRMAHWDIEKALDVEDSKAIDAVHIMLIELDKVFLSKDAQELLKFILTTDLTADSKHKRVGYNTVLNKAAEIMSWPYKRSRKALNALKEFYGERAIA